MVSGRMWGREPVYSTLNPTVWYLSSLCAVFIAGFDVASHFKSLTENDYRFLMQTVAALRAELEARREQDQHTAAQCASGKRPGRTDS